MSQPEFGRIVTTADILTALKTWRCLPKRAVEDAEAEFAGYKLALEGVPLRVLEAAVVRIVQGALGHAFHPSPSEARIACDAEWQQMARRASEERRLRDMRERMAEDRAEFHRPPEARARVAEVYRKFREDVDRRRGIMPDEEEIAAIRSKYSEAMLARIPDRPIAKTWETAGNASMRASG